MTNRYLQGPGLDNVFADEQFRPGQGASTYWTLGDHLGTIRDVVDNTGTIQKHMAYSAFGQKTIDSNSALNENFGFSGGFTDGETGKTLHWTRWTDPATGSWMSQDRKGFGGGDANLYRYVYNQPTNFIDPLGTDAAVRNDEGLQIGGIVSGALGIPVGVQTISADEMRIWVDEKDQGVVLAFLIRNWNTLNELQRSFYASLLSREVTFDVRKDGCNPESWKNVLWKFVEYGAEMGFTLGDIGATPFRWAGVPIPKGSDLFRTYEEVHKHGGTLELLFWIRFGGNSLTFGLLSVFESIGMAVNTGDPSYLEGIPAQLFYTLFFVKIGQSFHQEAIIRARFARYISSEEFQALIRNKANIDCSDLAEALRRFNGNSGKIIEIRAKISSETQLTLNVKEAQGVVKVAYHQVFVINDLVFDPRYMTTPMPLSVYLQMLKGLNPGGIIINQVW